MRRLIVSLLLLPGYFLQANPDSASIGVLVEQWDMEVQQHFVFYQNKRQFLVEELTRINRYLSSEELTVKKYVRLLNRKIELMERLDVMEELMGVELTRLRYKKGLELIRLLYEKVLGLDHHFSSMQTYQNIISLSNPNAYPEFQRSKLALQKRLKKENALRLPDVLESNPYLSPAFSLITSVLGSGQATEREEELGDVSCILDFTARMNSELSTIYYETEYLRESNATLKEECLNLFAEYVGVVGYHTALNVCRREDDWESVYDALDEYIENLRKTIESGPKSSKAIKQQVNMEFAVDQLINFINIYNSFISQGSKYYHKFEIIVSNYPNEESCRGQLPYEFENLKKDIQYSIERFNEAYNISALKGSKLKDLLYGFIE